MIRSTSSGPSRDRTRTRYWSGTCNRSSAGKPGNSALETTGKLPDVLVACVGGGSNAIGLFHPFLQDASVRLIGVEAGGQGLQSGRHAAPLNAGKPGVLHGNRTYLMEDENGQINPTHSISAGLDYPGVGPEHAWLKDSGRVEYVAVN